MGYIRMIARKTLRRSKPHGPRGKRIEPTVEQGLDDMETDAEADQRAIESFDREYFCLDCGCETDMIQPYCTDCEIAYYKRRAERDKNFVPPTCPNCGMNCINDPCFRD